MNKRNANMTERQINMKEISSNQKNKEWQLRTGIIRENITIFKINYKRNKMIK